MMTKLVFRNLYIYSLNEKKARKIDFQEGLNIITSSKIDGTDRGKSVIMRSLYHVLGADCKFDDNWKRQETVYILLFSIDEKYYYIFRQGDFFKLFDEKKDILFVTAKRKELAAKLKRYFNFAVQLPNQKEDNLEITPPAYNYLLNFIDQDHYAGTNFESFYNLKQYSNYKENVLYYHLGVFDENYFYLVKEMEKLKNEKDALERKQEISIAVYKKIADALGEDISYSKTPQSLEADVEVLKEEYEAIVGNLKRVKTKLIEFKNQKFELENILTDLKGLLKNKNIELENLNRNHCPVCNNILEETTDLRLVRYNDRGDISLLIGDIQHSLFEVQQNIVEETKKYQLLLVELEEYENKIGNYSNEISDILRHNSFIELRDELIVELRNIKIGLENIGQKNKILIKEKKRYNGKKENVNAAYCKYLTGDRNRFGLYEIELSKFDNIKHTFSASGSNRPIATLIWYMNLIKLKNIFNPSAIKFPIVLDSPNNVESDNEKEAQITNYLLESFTNENQMIISFIGFNENDITDNISCNIIYLANEKYRLLDSEEFVQNRALLDELIEKY